MRDLHLLQLGHGPEEATIFDNRLFHVFEFEQRGILYLVNLNGIVLDLPQLEQSILHHFFVDPSAIEVLEFGRYSLYIFQVLDVAGGNSAPLPLIQNIINSLYIVLAHFDFVLRFLEDAQYDAFKLLIINLYVFLLAEERYQIG